MLDINNLKKSGFFKEVFLKKGEVLFNEGDLDNNIYIVLIGELSVSKYTSKKKTESKILAYLKENDVFGEASLNNGKAKEVTIKATRKTALLAINGKEGIENFLKVNLADGLNLLKYIIFQSNKRLSESNYLITAGYKISKEINELQDINLKNIFSLIEEIKESIGVDHVMYYETNPVMENYVTLRYDTRSPGKMLSQVIELANNKLDLLSLKVDDYNVYSQNLSIGNNNLGYLVFLKKDQKFSENDKRVLSTASTSVSGLIKQKQLLDEQRNIEYMSE